MKRVALLVCLAPFAFAQTQVPNVFEDGKPAKAAEVNANFDALESAIDSNDEDFELFRADTQLLLPPSNCSTDKIIRWDGSAWACADDPLANISCGAGDTLKYDGSAFTCICVPPGTAITDSNFTYAISDWFANGNGEYGDITKWCTGAVTDMSEAFEGFNTFNEDISGWNTSNVINMRGMFQGAYAFNQDIGGWDTSKVTDMDSMFQNADTFNQDIDGWDTSKVTDMEEMFRDADAFNQDIGDWDTSKVTDMRRMFFNNTAFNQDLSSWDASAVELCQDFARYAIRWLAAYDGSISGKTPPLSASMIAAGCGN